MATVSVRYIVQDVDVAIEFYCRHLVSELRSADVEFRNDIVTGVGGKQILLDDPSGNPIELFEPTRRLTLPKLIHDLGEPEPHITIARLPAFPRPVVSPDAWRGSMSSWTRRRMRRCRSGSIPLSSRDGRARAHAVGLDAFS
jgi:catechol 2,3-dioxygenase-like lactoylglutathione lyase family enzyme